MKGDDCGPHIMALIFILIVVFYLIFESKFFENKKYNKLALAFCLLLIFWFITIFIRHVYPLPEPITLFEVNNEVKCFVGEPRCENGTIKIWTIGHFLVYFFIGLYVPGLYIEIFIVSIIYEWFEYAVGHGSKFIVDTTANMAGYILGSQLSMNE